MKKLCIFCLISLIIISCKTNEKNTGNEANAPNIIFLLTDDQRFDALGAMGNNIVQTPNLNRLAADGLFFKNSFVTTSICCTSRASIFSGQYARRHGINDFVTSFTDSAWANSYPALLKQNGYYTGFIGKFGVGDEEDMPKNTFDYWKGFGGWGYYETTNANGDSIHLTRRIGDESIDFLEIASKADAPFCLSVSFKAPHSQDGDGRQFIVDPAFDNILSEVTIPEQPLNKDAYYNSFPAKFRERNEARHRWNIRFSTPEKYQTMVKNYYELIYGVDQVVKRIRDKLAEKGLDKNTVIIFTSDNGYYLGEYGLAGKWYGHEESIRVPMIIYDPRTETKGKEIDQMALNIDIAPTILNFAGIDVPEGMQGMSLSKLLKDEALPTRKEFFYEHQFIRADWGHKPYIPGVEGIVREDVKYMRYLHGGDNVVYEELFDKKIADNELNNLIDNEAYQVLKQELSSQVDFYKTSLP